MPVKRMRMRPWLERMIEAEAITGLKWIDKEKTMFSIPWKHAARHGWEMDKDACLFKEWAVHTGKYSSGQACDPKTWKANFRCALNSLPDIEEVKDKSINKGHGAMRVFKMRPAVPKCKDKRSKPRDSKSRRKSEAFKAEEDSDYSNSQSPVAQPEDAMSTQENTIDSTVRTDPEVYCSVTPSEVPDWSLSVEIGSDNFLHSFPHRFEVSPEHSPDHDSSIDIVEICKQLEREAEWRCSSSFNGFLSNEACTSPESLWSDSSSELDDTPQYTTLNSSDSDEILFNFFPVSL